MRIDTTAITTWKVAKKTKDLRAKPLVSLLVDRSVTSKFLLDTLEGKEVLGDGAVVCVGEAGDAWQQMPKKLLAKYNVTAIDSDGWMVCSPKPENASNAIDTAVWLLEYNLIMQEKYGERVSPTELSIVGHWGQTLPDGTKNVQVGEVGDFILQDRNDPTDVWIVKKKLFNNTYSIIG